MAKIDLVSDYKDVHNKISNAVNDLCNFLRLIRQH